MFNRRIVMLISIVFAMILVFSACSKDENENENGLDIPKDVIEDADANPIELKDQLELELGETGYVVDQGNSEVVEFTLNSVHKTQKVGSEEKSEDKGFFIVADMDVKNHGDIPFSLKSMRNPDLVKGSDASKIEAGELTNKGDVLGIGTQMMTPEDALSEKGSLEEGEEESGEVYISSRGSADEYIIFFGLDDGDEGYHNKAAWKFDSDAFES